MRLEIKAFRGLKDRVIELPQTGLVRIAGNSEAGKSTVLHAINWALYGDEAVKSVTPLGETKASVVLSGLSGLESVARYKGPGRLVVNGVLENEVGQAEILRVLGMSSEQFSASSYVKQKMKGSLLTLGAADQIRFIQTLAFGAHDPEKYKKVIQDRFTLYSQTLNVKTSLRAQAQENLSRSKAHLETLEHPDVPPLEENKEFQSSISDLHRQIQDVQRDIQSETSLLNHPSRTLAPIAEALELEINALEGSLPSKEILDSELHTLNLTIRHASQTLAEAADTTIRQELKRQASEKITLAVQAGPAASLEQAKEGVASADTTLVVIRQSIATLTAEKTQIRHALNSVYECPACLAPLTLAANTLHHSHDGSAKNALLDTLATLDAQETQARSFVLGWERYRAGCVAQKQAIEEGTALLARAGNVVDTDFTEFIQTKTETLRIAEEEKQKITQNLNNIQFLTQNLAAKKAQLRDLSSKLAQNLPTEDQIKRNLEICTASLNVYQIRVSELSMQQAAYTDRKAVRDRAVILDQAFQAALRAHRSLQESLDKGVEEENLFIGFVTSANKLKKLSDESTMSAVGGIVNSLNTHIAQYTSLFFPEGGTQIFLTNEYTTKGGDRRAKMGLRIIHRGLEMDMDDFSGGAENRTILSAQLAVSDIFSSQLLMLDESLTGNHPELREEILDHLRVVAQNKLVLLIEHGVSDSSFDEVIYV